MHSPTACDNLIADRSQVVDSKRRDVRVVEGARLESVCRGNSTEGSNPSLSANLLSLFFLSISHEINETRVLSTTARVLVGNAEQFGEFLHPNGPSDIFECHFHLLR